MHKFLFALSAAALVVALQLPAAAADDDSSGSSVTGAAKSAGRAIENGADATGRAIKRGAEATGDALGITESNRKRYESMERGEHTVTGTVSSIDRDAGTVSLSTASTTLNLYFPPSALRDVSKGDSLTAILGFATPDKNPPAAAAEPRHVRAGDEPEHGENWVTGTVSSVDAATGVVDVNSDKAPLRVQFAPSALSDVHPGDRIAVETAYVRAPNARVPEK